MNKGKIIITISADGTPEIKVEGIKGSSCKSATRAIEEAFGTVIEDTPTLEMNERGGEYAQDSNRA